MNKGKHGVATRRCLGLFSGLSSQTSSIHRPFTIHHSVQRRPRNYYSFSPRWESSTGSQACQVGFRHRKSGLPGLLSRHSHICSALVILSSCSIFPALDHNPVETLLLWSQVETSPGLHLHPHICFWEDQRDTSRNDVYQPSEDRSLALRCFRFIPPPPLRRRVWIKCT